MKVSHSFVETIPEVLRDRTLYISIEYATAAHKCCCGCGSEVVTPLSPTDWKITYDGESVSLSPSIGSWSLPCQSHYWITRDEIRWSGQWTDEQIARGRQADWWKKTGRNRIETKSADDISKRGRGGIWMRIRRWIFGSS